MCPIIESQPLDTRIKKPSYSETKRGLRNIAFEVVKRAIQSVGFVSNQKGWKIDSNGNITLNTLTWNKLTAITSFETHDGFSTKGVGSSTFTPGFLGSTVETGATDQDFAVLYANPSNVVGVGYSVATSKSPIMQIVARVQDADFAETFLGIASITGAADWPLDNVTASDVYIGFHLKSDVIYAVSRKASTAVTSTNVGTTIDSIKTYRIEVDGLASGVVTKIRFYVNGTLVATHITNLPGNTEDLDIFMGVRNWNDGGQQTMDLVNLLYVQDFE